MRRPSTCFSIVVLSAAAGLAGLAGAGCSSSGAGTSDTAVSNGYYRGPIGNGAFGEAVPASDREPGNFRSATSSMNQAGADHGYVGNGAFGEAP